ncbi:MAG TPA: gamma-glutamylcyclotransferase [Thermoprotei archaeon]|nr:gamma-glutamylcyclotransferase [Thermoprotei archaeon]
MVEAMPNVFVFNSLMTQFMHPWRKTVEQGKLRIILDNFKRRVGALDEYIIVWKKESTHPYLVREPNGIVVGEVLYDVPNDVIHLLDEYELSPKRNYRVEETIRLEDGSTVEAFVYVWRGEDIHEKDEEFKTLLPDDLIPESLKQDIVPE